MSALRLLGEEDSPKSDDGIHWSHPKVPSHCLHKISAVQFPSWANAHGTGRNVRLSSLRTAQSYRPLKALLLSAASASRFPLKWNNEVHGTGRRVAGGFQKTNLSPAWYSPWASMGT